MKDHKGKRIVLGSLLKCINDVNYGAIYKAKRWCTVHPNLCIHDNDGTPLLLSEFANEDGCLVDFEVISKEEAFAGGESNE